MLAFLEKIVILRYLRQVNLSFLAGDLPDLPGTSLPSDAEVRFGPVLDLLGPNREPDFGSVLHKLPGPEPDVASGPQGVRSGSNVVRTLLFFSLLFPKNLECARDYDSKRRCVY